MIKSTWRTYNNVKMKMEKIIPTENNPCAKKWSDGCTLNNVLNQ
jgi:hypothetical protein